MQAQPYQAPQANLNVESVYCRSCGAHIAANALQCPQCQASQNLNPKSKVTAGVLALLFGGLGVHRFYLGQWWGLFYLLFFWTWIPALIALVEGIVFLCTSDAKWQAKYANVKRGSTLVIAIIGVFVLVFITGILAAIAIPAYQDYVKRAQQAQLEQQR
ncbi:NINE protein [Pseudomonas sp. 2FE]|uniref:NINE protein n=1 Tax=Pseudomonas sp. 2FE TaxID=2502190 RepID=UPI0010F460A2|nr:NINE protein [Pseudomonas sp. 2FE]